MSQYQQNSGQKQYGDYNQGQDQQQPNQYNQQFTNDNQQQQFMQNQQPPQPGMNFLSSNQQFGQQYPQNFQNPPNANQIQNPATNTTNASNTFKAPIMPGNFNPTQAPFAGQMFPMPSGMPQAPGINQNFGMAQIPGGMPTAPGMNSNFGMPPIPQMPFTMPPLPNFPMTTIQAQPTAVTRKDNKRELELEERIQQLEDEHQQEKKKFAKIISNLKEEKNQFELEKQDLESQLSNVSYEVQKLKKKIDQQNVREQELISQNQLLTQETQDQQQSINQMMLQTKSRNTAVPQQGLVVSTTNDDWFTKQINKLKAEKQQLEEKVQQYQKDLSSANDKLLELTNDCDKEHKNFLNAQDEVVNRNKQIDQLRKKIHEHEQSQFAVQNLLKEKNSNIRELEILTKDQEVQIQQLELDVKMQTETSNKYKELLSSKGQVSAANVNQQIEQFEAQKKKMAAEQNKKLEQQRQNLEREKEQFLEKSNKEREILQQRKNRDKQMAEEAKAKRMGLLGGIMQEAKKEQGQLDVCFLVDVTGSMESYKEQTKQSVMGALQIIKQSVNRDTNWAAICYQDKAEKTALKGKYHQFPFSKNSDQLQKWFDTIKCSGGGDGAEDIQGAIEQMNQLNWPSKFRIAILICDAPCHGKKYHNGITSDDSPNDEIRGAIEKMIDQNIIFIGLNFTRYTTLMYEEFKKIFIAKKKEDTFLYQDLQNADKGKMSIQMVKYLGEASKNATHTNKRQTKSKNENQAAVVRNKDGAMESLCKAGNFYDFEKQDNVKCVDTKFKVLKVEIKQESFDKNIQTIEKLLVPSDYRVTEEGQWDCIRTEKPFAFGMMKDVFLMKKKNGSQQELYVIKTPIGSQPYKTLNDALTECRSHLICQKLMKKFQEDLSNKMEEKGIQKKLPSIVYSDFLILQESYNSFWIAERFFNGEFVKYNNNFGFIEEDINDMNKMAQAFSFYTYFTSDFNYMVSDVQGVGIYFTDPAINTKNGNFDETDMGLEGQQMYLVSYELKKNILSREILELLEMYE